MLECRSQARFTARQLVGHIRTIDRRTRAHNQHQHQQVQVNQGLQTHTATRLTPAGFTARTHLRHRALKESRARQFKYSFAPNNTNANSAEDAAGFVETDSIWCQQQAHQSAATNAIGNLKHTFVVNRSPALLSAFVRFGSRRRSSARRRRSGRGHRQVRFQPIPQAINISNHESSIDDENNEGQLSSPNIISDNNTVGDAMPKFDDLNAEGAQLNSPADDDFGWGSDFDEQSVDSSLVSQGDKSQADNSTYLLEMGKPSSDFKAIKDVIQDQGTSGQFKLIDPDQSMAMRSGQVCYASDSQSHCSDESGSTSGLDSNHSGSQDSGHSTQHSGCSAHSCASRCHHDHESASIETESPVSGSPAASIDAHSESPSSPNCCREAEQAVAHLSKANSDDRRKPEEVVELIGEDSQERRKRFLQNRLIINSKLESMFKSRQPASQASLPQHADTSHKSADIARAKSCKLPDKTVPIEGDEPQDLETRKSLLEQQRQISLKLKQKPRRKSAKRALNPLDCDHNNLTTEDTGSYVSSGSSELARHNSIRRNRIGRDSLTKQLSMICLRQAGQIMRDTTHQYHEPATVQQQQQVMLATQSSGSVCGPDQLVAGAQPIGLAAPGERIMAPRAAQSLRQLVKEVIDDCERPNKLSPLTMSILNRSDSLSSDLANSADEAPHSSRENTNLSRSTLGRSSGSLNSLKAADRSRDRSGSVGERHANDTGHYYDCSSPPIGYIYPVQHSTPQQLHQVDRSLSSVGTIDGLEYSRADIGEQQFQAQQLHVGQHNNKIKINKSIGSYLKSLREFSRHKLAKVKLMSGHGEGATELEQKLGRDDGDQLSLGHRLAPLTNMTLHSGAGANLACNYNYEYQLDDHQSQSRQYQQQSKHHILQPEGLNTLAGAWRRRTKRTSIVESPMASSPGAKADAFTDHFVTISNRKWKSCHLRTSLMQIAFTGFSDSKTATDDSPIRASKQHLAYLNNSRNFTDEDNY